ncbi:hypothetical protein SPLC1_S033710 [Arthrospira platensis C1]|nr:hypothetical protein SPLC1_S033710 [Arthrospira platensis C1]
MLTGAIGNFQPHPCFFVAFSQPRRLPPISTTPSPNRERRSHF